MKINDEQSIGIIRKALIVACLNNKPAFFLPYLMTSNAATKFPSKLKFYQSFKFNLKCAHKNSKGILHLKIEKVDLPKYRDCTFLNFYDTRHKYDRISIHYDTFMTEIRFNMFPF